MKYIIIICFVFLFSCRAEREVEIYFDGLSTGFQNQELLIDIKDEPLHTYELKFRMFKGEFYTYNKGERLLHFNKLKLVEYINEIYFYELLYDSFKMYLNEEEINIKQMAEEFEEKFREE